MFVVVGARDFSPEITVLPIGTEVPCSDRVPPQIPICYPSSTYNTSIFNCRVNKDWVILSRAVASAVNCIADNLLVVQLCLDGNFPGKNNLITLYQSFTANTAFRLLR